MSLLNEIQNDQMAASTAKKSRIEEFNKTLVTNLTNKLIHNFADIYSSHIISHV